MKNILKITLVMFFYMLCFIAIAQKDTIKRNDSNKIKYLKMDKNGNKNKLIFKNHSIDAGMNEKYYNSRISPDSLKAAVLEKNEIDNSGNRNLIIFDSDGKEIKTIVTPATDLSFINNKGCVIAEIRNPIDKMSNSLDFTDKIQIYNEAGKNQLSRNITFFHSAMRFTSVNNKIFIIYGFEYDEKNIGWHDKVIYIFNDDFSLLGECKISQELSSVIKIDELNSLIYLGMYAKDNLKKTVIIDYSGKTINTIDGWIK